MITLLRTRWQRVLCSLAGEQGAELTEYALLLLFIALVTVGALALLGGVVQGLYQSLVDLWPG